MDSNVERNVGHSQPVSESVSVPAPLELEPTPVATCSADVSRAEITSTMVLRSNDVREIRSYVDKPEPESRQEVVSRSEMELAAEIAAPISVREGVRVRASWQAYVRSFGIVVSII